MEFEGQGLWLKVSEFERVLPVRLKRFRCQGS